MNKFRGGWALDARSCLCCCVVVVCSLVCVGLCFVVVVVCFGFVFKVLIFLKKHIFSILKTLVRYVLMVRAQISVVRLRRVDVLPEQVSQEFVQAKVEDVILHVGQEGFDGIASQRLRDAELRQNSFFSKNCSKQFNNNTKNENKSKDIPPQQKPAAMASRISASPSLTPEPRFRPTVFAKRALPGRMRFRCLATAAVGADAEQLLHVLPKQGGRGVGRLRRRHPARAAPHAARGRCRPTI